MTRTGGCLCGRVRFRLAGEPFDAGWCHCRTCQRNSGSPAMAFASVEDGDWVVTAGAESIGTVQSSSFGHRAFCAECGTPLYMRVDHQPETVDFSIATLDNPAAVKPGFHIFWGSRLPWFPADELPTFERFRPNTRGLAGREPPNGS
ncbi:GFA family protein [uncultured Sphingomonas sp.]|uniref:GFA family protein n=1 Tax=uncultured Sphingomonas sp. TaxID=158754 RepID=UPI0025EC57C6|nr:GFA family protein [uncultured Sphingomonas sp.]